MGYKIGKVGAALSSSLCSLSTDQSYLSCTDTWGILQARMDRSMKNSFSTWLVNIKLSYTDDLESCRIPCLLRISLAGTKSRPRQLFSSAHPPSFSPSLRTHAQPLRIILIKLTLHTWWWQLGIAYSHPKPSLTHWVSAKFVVEQRSFQSTSVRDNIRRH